MFGPSGRVFLPGARASSGARWLFCSSPCRHRLLQTALGTWLIHSGGNGFIRPLDLGPANADLSLTIFAGERSSQDSLNIRHMASHSEPRSPIRVLTLSSGHVSARTRSNVFDYRRRTTPGGTRPWFHRRAAETACSSRSTTVMDGMAAPRTNIERVLGRWLSANQILAKW